MRNRLKRLFENIDPIRKKHNTETIASSSFTTRKESIKRESRNTQWMIGYHATQSFGSGKLGELLLFNKEINRINGLISLR